MFYTAAAFTHCYAVWRFLIFQTPEKIFHQLCGYLGCYRSVKIFFVHILVLWYMVYTAVLLVVYWVIG